MSRSYAIRSAAALIGIMAAATSMAAKPDEPVCRDYPRPGSHMMMHVCVTQAEWDAMRAREAAFQTASLSAAGGFSPAWSGGSGPGTVTAVSVNMNR